MQNTAPLPKDHIGLVKLLTIGPFTCPEISLDMLAAKRYPPGHPQLAMTGA